MLSFQSTGMLCDGEQLKILDQTLLPHYEKWLPCNSVEALVTIIKRLAIRGAPAIGISAALLLGLRAKKGHSQDQLVKDSQTLIGARPTAVNMTNYLERLNKKIHANDYPQSFIIEVENIVQEDFAACERMAEYGAKLVKENENILTHCNTGGLATAGVGTAFGVLSRAHGQGKNVFIWASETRPLLQGARLTAWECIKKSIPHRIICDNMAAMLIKKGEVDRIFVGSDRIAANGDFANKIGTYSLAVLARHHNIPFYVVAPQTTIDPLCPDGESIPIEMRDESEVKGVNGSFGTCQWCPTDSEAYNPAFDITPKELVTAWILDSGVFFQKDTGQKSWWKQK